MDLVKIGKFIQELRKEKGLTQEQLAEQMGVARRTVSRWETGNNMPDISQPFFYQVYGNVPRIAAAISSCTTVAAWRCRLGSHRTERFVCWH